MKKENKKKYFWLFFIILLLVVVWIVINNSNFSIQSDNKKDYLISSCVDSVKECINIVEGKEGISVKILKYEKINNSEYAEEFWDTWRNDANQFDYLTHIDFYNWNENFPVVMFGVSKIYPAPSPASPKALICDSNGKLIELSRDDLGC
jgi:hypothetical protein